MEKKMKNKVLMSLVLLAFVTVSAAFAQTPTLDKLTFTAQKSSGKDYNLVKPVNDKISGAVVIPDTYNNIPVTTIGINGFLNCTGITSVTIPASMTTINQSAFRTCTNITSVTFAVSNTSLGTNAFPGDLVTAYKAYGAGTYTRPAGGANWTKQGSAVASTPAPAQTAQQPASTAPGQATMDKLAFSTSGGGYQARAANKMISGAVIIPDTYNNKYVVNIGSFSDCQSLTSVTIPSSVNTISGSAFSGCAGLTSVTIPASVTSIGSSAFAKCNSLTSVTFQGTASAGTNSFPGDLANAYKTGGAGTYTRQAGQDKWTKK
jgi:hypothetical protein